MKRLPPFILLAVFQLVPAVLCGVESSPVYIVSELTRVLSPVSFECRLGNSPYGRDVRFQVFLKDTEPYPDLPASATREALERALRSGGSIELHDVKMRNYFRMDARVQTASGDLKAKLLAEKIVQEIVPAETELAASRQDVNPKPIYPPSKAASTVQAVKIGGSYAYDLQRLLRTKVDLSGLRSETPFYDALAMISGSVEPRLPIVVFWADLENNAFVEKDSPIGVEGFGVISAAEALDAILYSVGGYGTPLKFTIQGGILKIGTLASLSRKTTKVYSVADLVAAPSYDRSEEGGNYGGGSGFETTNGLSGTRN